MGLAEGAQAVVAGNHHPRRFRARPAGIDGFKVYPRSQVLSLITYPNETYSVQGSSIGLVRKWLLVGPVRTLAAIFLFVVFKRFDGIVTMKKP